MFDANLADRIAYAAKHRNEAVRMASRSGGVFTALTDAVFKEGGVVYGVRLDDHLEAVHARAATGEERDAFRGSKYIQSRVGTAFQDCRDDLRRGLTVLFSGTPCQVDGLKNYLKATGSPTDRLIALEILCHGVPSLRVYRDYLAFIGQGETVTSFDFRDKTGFGWKDHVETATIGGRAVSSRRFTTLFYSHNILRPSCFHCPYKQTERYADITIGDYWGIDNLDRRFNDDRGVSLVLVQSEKGRRLWESAAADLTVEAFPCANSLQPALQGNYREPASRSRFWRDYESMPFSDICKKYGTDRGKDAKRLIKKLLGRG